MSAEEPLPVSHNSVDHLVKMANQIAACIPAADAEAKVQSTATHIKKFWSPSMIKNIRQYTAEGGEGLTPAAAEAVATLVK